MHWMRPLALLACLLTGPALADDRSNDEIVLRLQAEDWVQTATAKVTAVVETVLTGDQAGQQNSRVPPVLAELAPGGEWRVTAFDRTRDASGLERWRVTAEARLSEAGLGGIYDRSQKVSRPGQQVTVTEVQFQPTLAERETTAAKLRAEIYRRAAEEVARAAQVWPDRGFRVQRIDFAFGLPSPRPMPRMARAMAAQEMMPPSAPAPEQDAGVNVSERMTLTATVVLAVPPPPRGDRK